MKIYIATIDVQGNDFIINRIISTDIDFDKLKDLCKGRINLLKRDYRTFQIYISEWQNNRQTDFFHGFAVGTPRNSIITKVIETDNDDKETEYTI